MKICYYPAFSDQELLNEQVTRACFYLAPLRPRQIVFASATGAAPRELKPFYDPTIAVEWERLDEEGVLSYAEPETLDALLEAADVVVCWQGKEVLGDRLGALVKRGKRVFDVDRTHRMEGSLYIDVADKLSDIRDETIAKSHERYCAFSKTVEGLHDAYLFCTGPSVEEYRNFRFDGGISIVCNSVINDPDLMAAVRPKLHVFADPIFHFGCSRYAYQFRRSLLQAVEKWDLLLVIPLKYAALFTAQMPELADRTIAIPFDQKISTNYSLSSTFVLRTTDNVLTFLMLPLAGSLARNVYLLGCDGRPLEENDYFWSHNPKTQFVGEMENIQLAHPSFFKLDYNEYYLRHCDRLEEYFRDGEAQDKTFWSLTFSHIPALITREYPFRRAAGAERLWLNMVPDLIDGEDQAYRMAARLESAVSETEPFFSLAAKTVAEARELGVVPVFADRTWDIRDLGQDIDAARARFRLELAQLAMRLRRLACEKTALMYSGDIRHVAEYVAAGGSLRASKVHTHLNLFMRASTFLMPTSKEARSMSFIAKRFVRSRNSQRRG